MRKNFSIVLVSARMRLITDSRYPGRLFMDLVIPIAIAAMPILLGRAAAGAAVAEVFSANTGTTNYAAFMLIGASMFSIVSSAFWHVAHWLRWEQETGTLEAIYLTPTHRIWVAAGTALFSCIRSLLIVALAFPLGAVILEISPLQGEIVVALLFLAVGLIPLYGMTLLFGALVLKVKEIQAILNLMQWGVTFLMGVFFPLTVLPPLLRALALLFPPTWMMNGVRAALLGLAYYFRTWYFDLAILGVFLIFAPLTGIWVFNRVEYRLRRNEGVGTF